MKNLKTTVILLFFFTSLNSQNIVINEFCSSNNSVIQDRFGEFSDWIELYNRTGLDYNLKNFSLSDDSDEPRKWVFPDVEIEAKGFLLVFASGKDTIVAGEPHTNFKIKQSGEPLILSDWNGEIIDFVDSTDVATDKAFARIPDGNVDWSIVDIPTPNAPNAGNADLLCSHPSGFYQTEFSLTLSGQTANQKIYYTLNGNAPTPNDFLYNEPIPIKKSDGTFRLSAIPTTPLVGQTPLENFIWQQPKSVFTSTPIRFAAFENDVQQGKVYSKNFFVGENVENRYDFPVVNISVDSAHFFDYKKGIYVPGFRFDSIGFLWYPDGNYLNEGDDWERPIHLTYFEPNGKLAFETDAGIRTHGNASAAFPQKSMKVYFRNEYGMNELDYPVFKNSDNQKFKRLLFRNGGNDFLTNRFKDAMLQKVIADLDVDLQAFQPSVVFLNGEYWGLHNIREKYDRFHFKYNFGVDKDEVNVLDFKGRSEEGDNAEYLKLIDFVNENDLSEKANYDYVAEQFDMSNFIDFQIAEIYFANYDFPCNNHKIWKSNDPGAKWRFAIFDLDFSFGFDRNSRYDVNSFEHAAEDGTDWPHCKISNAIFRSLLKNEDFKNRLVDRFAFCLKNTFAPNRILELIGEFETLFEDEMPEHIDRWHYPKNMSIWRKEINDLRSFAVERPCYVDEHIRDFFQLDTFNFDCTPDTLVTDGEVYLFPNPSDGSFTISNDSAQHLSDATIRIVNAAGQVVFVQDEIFIGSKERFEIRVDLPLGMYFVRVESSGGVIQGKLILSRNG